jgi:hypothetical protein
MSHILLSQFLRVPQPGGPGPRIYILQERGGPDIPRALDFSLATIFNIFIFVLHYRYMSRPLLAILKCIIQLTVRSYYTHSGSVVLRASD